MCNVECEENHGPSWGTTVTLDSLTHSFFIFPTLPSWYILFQSVEGTIVCTASLTMRRKAW